VGKNKPIIALLIILAVVFFIIFIMFAANIQVSGDTLVAALIVMAIVSIIVLLLMWKGTEEEPMQKAINFAMAWWLQRFSEKLEERFIYFVERFYGTERYFGGWVMRGSGRTAQKGCIVLKKTSNGFSVAKVREVASHEDEANPFFGLETEMTGGGSPVPHPLIPFRNIMPTEQEKERVVVNVGKEYQDEEDKKGD
jgi:hypothetical protein